MKTFTFISILLLTLVHTATSQVYSIAEFESTYGDFKSFNKPYALTKSMDINQSIEYQSRLQRIFEIYIFHQNVNIKSIYKDDQLYVHLYINDLNEPEKLVYEVKKYVFDSTLGTFHDVHIEISAEEEKILRTTFEGWMKNLEMPDTSFTSQYLYVRLSSIAKTKNCNKQEAVCTIEEAKSANPEDVKIVNLSDLDLKEFPEVILNFKNVEKLILSNNLLSELPKKVWKLKNLKSVDLANNFIDNEHANFTKNKTIHTLNMQYNTITQIPKRINKLKSLEILLLGNNELTDLKNQHIKKNKSLKDLNIYHSYITGLPKKLYRFKALEVLDLYHNKLKNLPTDFQKLTELKTLAISYNNFWKLPDLSSQQKLQHLYAHHNKIDRIDGNIPGSLETLDIGFNMLNELPQNVGQLQELSVLDISNNQINEIPKAILTLPKLQKVYYNNNTFCTNENESKAFQVFEETITKKLKDN